MKKINIICPLCGKKLNDEFYCSSCGKVIFIKSGSKVILRNIIFSDKSVFHENWYQDKKVNVYRNLIKEKFSWLYPVFPLFFRKSALIKKVFKKYLDSKNKNLILDLGCGFGTPTLSNYGEVIGLDVSEKAITTSSIFYNFCIQIDSEDKFHPFLDETFDLIYHSNLEAHISFDKKNLFWKEQFRILKHGGKILMITEDITSSWPYGKAISGSKSKELMDEMGHFGFEKLDSKLRRIRNNGLDILKIIKIEGSISSFSKIYNWYKYIDKKSFLDKLIWYVSKTVNKSIILNEIFTTAINPLASIEIFFRKPEQCSSNLIIISKK